MNRVGDVDVHPADQVDDVTKTVKVDADVIIHRTADKAAHGVFRQLRAAAGIIGLRTNRVGSVDLCRRVFAGYGHP